MLCFSATGAKASLVQFSTTGGMFTAGDGLQQISIERTGDTDNESMSVSVIVLNTSLNSNEYEFSPVEFSWAAGDNSSRNLTVTITAKVKDAGRQTITFGLCKVDGGGDLGDPVRYEMVIEFPENASIETPEPSIAATETPDTAIINASPTLTVQENMTNTSGMATISASTKPVNNSSATNMTGTANAQDMPIVLFGGLVSLVVIITAIYLLLFKRN